MQEAIVFSIVLASPSDMSADRDVATTTVEECNHLTKSKSVQFSLLKWENEVTPAIGDYTQDAINKQLLRSYDLLIALFGTRLGSSTPNSPSGSVEEVRHALANHKSPLGENRLMVFFKRTHVSVLDCDPEQIKQLQEFRRELQSKNVLYAEYDKAEDLAKQVRLALIRIADQHAAKVSAPIASMSDASTSAVSNDPPTELDIEDVGLLDWLAMFESQLTSATTHIGEASVVLTSVTSTTNKYVLELNSLNPQTTVAGRKDILNEYAGKLESLAGRLQSSVSLAQTSMNAATDFHECSTRLRP